MLCPTPGATSLAGGLATGVVGAVAATLAATPGLPMASGGSGALTTGAGSGEAVPGMGSGGVWAKATGAEAMTTPVAAIAARIRLERSNIRIAPSFALSPWMGYRAVTGGSHLLRIFPDCA